MKKSDIADYYQSVNTAKYHFSASVNQIKLIFLYGTYVVLLYQRVNIRLAVFDVQLLRHPDFIVYSIKYYYQRYQNVIMATAGAAIITLFQTEKVNHS